MLNGFILLGIFILSSCKNNTLPMHSTDHYNPNGYAGYVFDKKNIIAVKNGKLREMPNFEKLKSFIEKQEGTFDNNLKTDILLIFIDTLRNDYINPTDTPNIMSLKNDPSSLRFQHSISNSTITHHSSFSLFYSLPSMYREFMIEKGWSMGSIHANILKKNNYRLYSYGSPYQYCVRANRLFNNRKGPNGENELFDSAESNIQLLFSQKSTNLLDFCYEIGPNLTITSQAQLFPSVPEFALDKNKIKVLHQAYQDHQVTNDLLEKFENIDKEKKERDFYFYYLSSVHDPYAWLEFGIPTKEKDETDEKDENDEKEREYLPTPYKIDTPNIPWNPAMSKKRSAGLKDSIFDISIRNSYRNAVRGVDYQIGRVIDKLKQLGIYDDMIIALVSDHGELLMEKKLDLQGDNNINAHCCNLYRQNTNIPIIIKKPAHGGFANSNDETSIIQLIDVFPTMYNFLGYNQFSQLNQFITGKNMMQSTRNCAVANNPVGLLGPRSFFIFDKEYYHHFIFDKLNSFDSNTFYYWKQYDINGNYNVYDKNSKDNFKKLLGNKNITLQPCLNEIFTTHNQTIQFQL